MENYYSIVRFVNNPLSEESIALGLVIISPNKQSSAGTPTESQVMFRISEAKVSFAKKLNPGCARLLDYSLKQLRGFLESELQDQSSRTVQFPVRVKYPFLERLSSYNNGLLQFSKPRYIESVTLATAFEEYYTRFIEPQASAPAEKVTFASESLLQRHVKENFYKPLRQQIDVDFTLSKQQIPSLFFDYHLDGIGVNGAMYAVKAIDLNGKQPLDTIQKELSEYESVIDRLNLFAEEHKIRGRANYYLVTDPYQGPSRDRRDLYALLSKEHMPFFNVVDSDSLAGIVQEFRRKNVRKFSEVLQEV